MMQPPSGKQPAVQAHGCCVVGAALNNACGVCMCVTRGLPWHAACQPLTQLAFKEPLQTTGLVGFQLTAIALGENLSTFRQAIRQECAHGHKKCIRVLVGC